MSPLDALVEEHNTIRDMLQVIDSIVLRMRWGERINNRDLWDIVDFLYDFADSHHHEVEEKILFSALMEAGVSSRNSLLEVARMEHKLGAVYLQGMRTGLTKIDDQRFANLFMVNANQYVSLQRYHMCKENTRLIPMAIDLVSELEYLEDNGAPMNYKPLLSSLLGKYRSPVNEKSREHSLTDVSKTSYDC